MKIAFNHLVKRIDSKITIEEISNKLFQLGHENEIENGIIDIEITPNRGDCLSVIGILRDLGVFYDINYSFDTYEEHIEPLSLNFVNNAKNACPNISFLKINIDEEVLFFNEEIATYFKELNLPNNNFFTDLSNYLSYEMGQPIHCYDASKIDDTLTLDYTNQDSVFHTLFDEEIKLTGKNLVFSNNNEIINLAGVIGGKSTACSKKTRCVLVECAYFNPEEIIGKSIKYDINSDAAYKFERGVDILSQEKVLRRFLRLVEEHAHINEAKLYSAKLDEYNKIQLKSDVSEINKILGLNITKEKFHDYLGKLGFQIIENKIIVPSYRNDILSNNDLAEEIARVIGYDNIETSKFKISHCSENSHDYDDAHIKNILVNHGFYEVINSPFSSIKSDYSVKIDNPLDSNKKYLRTNLQQSLIDNLLYNERRQKDSIKLFEISDIYLSKSKLKKRKVIGMISSGRLGKNYKEFSKKITNNYIFDVIKNFVPENKINIINISRDSIKSKLKDKIFYTEIDFDDIKNVPLDSKNKNMEAVFSDFQKYIPISEYPSSARDLSFSITNYSKLIDLERCVLDYKNNLLKEAFVFDYYKNDEKKEIKVGFRLIFQRNDRTIKDIEVASIIDDIINLSLKIDSVSMPGL